MGGVGWGGDDNIHCAGTHARWNGTGLAVGVGMVTFIVLSHMLMQLGLLCCGTHRFCRVGSGQVGMRTFIVLAHMLDGMELGLLCCGTQRFCGVWVGDKLVRIERKITSVVLLCSHDVRNAGDLCKRLFILDRK